MGRRGAVITTVAAVAVVGAVGFVGFLGVRALVTAFGDLDPPPAIEHEQYEPVTEAAPAHAPTTGEGAADPAWIAETAEATRIPARALEAYAAADIYAQRELGCAVGWNTLAGIGWVESHHGTLQGGSIDADGVARPAIVGIPLDGTNDTMAIPDTDGGELDGDPVWDRAVGPMQFIPETWRRWAVDGSGDGRADPHQIDDAAATSARYLCRLDGSLEEGRHWIRAIRSYNDTYDYQVRVATAAASYADATR